MPTALITGASGAIGGELARRLKNSGWTVYGTYHENQGSVPEGISAHRLDLKSPGESVRELGTSIRSQLESNSLDLLVHASGTVEDGLALNLDSGQWRRLRSVHLDGAFALAREFGSFLKQGSPPAHFVVISSLVGLRGGFGQSNYSAVKAAQIGLVQSLAREWAPKVLVNAIRPPLTESSMVRQIPSENLPEVKQDILTDKIARPRQTAELLEYLTEQDNVTGQLISDDHRIHSLWG